MKNSNKNWGKNSDKNSFRLKHGNKQHQFTDEQRRKGGSSKSLAKSVSAQLRTVDIDANHILKNYKQLQETGSVNALFDELVHTLISIRKELDNPEDDTKTTFWKKVKYFEKVTEYIKLRFGDIPKDNSVKNKMDVDTLNKYSKMARERGLGTNNPLVTEIQNAMNRRTEEELIKNPIISNNLGGRGK